MNHIDVREMCIKYDFCTNCDCTQYYEMLNMCDIDVKSFDTLKKRLYEIANLIYCYSNNDEIVIETIMFYLMNECVKTLFEIE